MTYTETEIDAALSWGHSGYHKRFLLKEVLWCAAERSNIDGSFHEIAEKILRAHIAELSALANVLISHARTADENPNPPRKSGS